MSPTMVPSAGVSSSLAALVPRLANFLASRLESLEPALSLTQLSVMKHIAEGTTRPVDLAQRARVSGATMSEILERLSSMDAVSRERDLSDRRTIQLALTPTGRLLLADRSMRIERELDQLIGPAGTEPLATIERAVRTLHVALDVRQESGYSVGTASA
ncbi:MarR family transcriptional regulator [bacterium]|nr:MAG: MarR family transcriptional regulator [bacterium]